MTARTREHRENVVHVGFAIGSGDPVSIPIRHMAVTGQTQESGKTTTLEALVDRVQDDAYSAIAFVTKRGEQSFANARRIEPYFRDRADWQFVTSLIDATLQEKNKFLRPWIMKICRTTRTLADVQREVRKALEKAKGINEGVYTQLDAYLDLIVPELARVPMSSGLTLTAGLNVMDLAAFNTPMQMLFVQSAIDWVNAHARRTIVIVPEAWEFIPEGKGSPVKASAVDLVRKGAGLGNYIWVDSQDMAGVDKTILRGCAVWLIGVQREANEIKRNLANIPASIRRPKPADIASLDRGEFYACWKDRTVKLYVQPAWMERESAQRIATATKDDREALLAIVHAGRQLGDHVSRSRRPGESLAATYARTRAEQPPSPEPKERTVNESEARELRDRNEQLVKENAELRSRIERLEDNAFPKSTFVADSLARAQRPPTASPPREYSPEETFDNEAMYQAFKRRLLEEAPKEPALLRVLATRPELEVSVTRHVIEAKGDTLRGRIAQLLAKDFFVGGQTGVGTQKELARRGNDPGPANTYKELDNLAQLGFLTIEQGRDDRSRPRKEYHQVPGMKVNIIETR